MDHRQRKAERAQGPRETTEEVTDHGETTDQTSTGRVDAEPGQSPQSQETPSTMSEAGLRAAIATWLGTGD